MIQKPAIPCPAPASSSSSQQQGHSIKWKLCLFAPPLLAAAAQMD